MSCTRTSPAMLLGLAVTLLAEACTPGAVRERPLTPHPVEGPSFWTLDQVVPQLEGLDPRQLDMALFRRRAIIGGREEDPFAALLSLSEYPDLIYLDMWFFNRSKADLELSPEMAVLVDGARMQFRQLLPHDAANLLLAHQRRVPPYEPKTEYRVETYHYGNYSRSTVREVPSSGLDGLGEVIASLIIQSGNKKLTEAAGVIYARGLVPGATVAADAVLRVGLTWLNTAGKVYPLELRLPALGYRVRFDALP